MAEKFLTENEVDKIDEGWETKAVNKRLTEEQLKLLKKYSKKKISERPSYFRADTNESITISKDFENFLILAPTQFKEKGIELINNYKASQQWEAEKRAVTLDVLEKDQNHVTAIYSELESEYDSYKEFQNSFSFTPYSEAVELGYLMKDLKESLKFVSFYYERFYQLDSVERFLLDRESSIFDESNYKEVQSWRGPLIAYVK